MTLSRPAGFASPLAGRGKTVASASGGPSAVFLRLKTTSAVAVSHFCHGVLAPALLGIILAGTGGCPPPPEPPRRALGEIVSAIEGNAAKLNSPLWASDVQVKARVTDKEGRQHVQNLDGHMLFEKPRRLLLQLSPPIGDPIMQIGSNDDEFWVWVEADINRMWWGKYRHLGKPCADDMFVRPDELLTAIGIGGLPKESSLHGPAPARGRRHDILYYLCPRVEGGWTLREYRVGRLPPYQIELIVSRDLRGDVEMSALLQDYRLAWEGGPYVPGVINVLWPRSGDTFTLWINNPARPQSPIMPTVFDRPVGERIPPAARNQVQQIDADCDMLDVAREESARGSTPKPGC